VHIFSLHKKWGGGGAPAPNAPRFRGLCIYNYHMQLYTIIEDYILYNLCMLVHNLIHCQSPRARPLVFPVFYICFWENSHLHGSASFSSCSCNSSYGEFPQRRASFSFVIYSLYTIYTHILVHTYAKGWTFSQYYSNFYRFFTAIWPPSALYDSAQWN
jgi:hypothetical protein